MQGSEPNPYVVTIVQRGGQATAICTCPYRGGDWCKHAVAVALTVIRDTDEDAERKARKAAQSDELHGSKKAA